MCVLFQHAADEDGSLADRRREGNGPVVIGVGRRADDGGKEGNRGKDEGKTGGVVLDAAAERGEVGQGSLI